METKCTELEAENCNLKKLTPLALADRENCLIAELRKTLIDSESACQNLRDQNAQMALELCDLRAKLDILQRNQENAQHKHDSSKDLANLREKLKSAEELCEELMEENDSLKIDIRGECVSTKIFIPMEYML